jgi:hypothetical protein
VDGGSGLLAVGTVGEATGAGHDGRFCVDALGQQVVFVLSHYRCNTTVRVYTDASVPLLVSQLAEALLFARENAMSEAGVQPMVIFSLSASDVGYQAMTAADGVTCLIASSEKLTPAIIVEALEAAYDVYREHIKRG